MDGPETQPDASERSDRRGGERRVTQRPLTAPERRVGPRRSGADRRAAPRS